MPEVTREQFETAVRNERLVEHEPIPGDGRRNYSDPSGAWRGVQEGEGSGARYILNAPSQNL